MEAEEQSEGSLAEQRHLQAIVVVPDRCIQARVASCITGCMNFAGAKIGADAGIVAQRPIAIYMVGLEAREEERQIPISQILRVHDGGCLKFDVGSRDSVARLLGAAVEGR